MYAISFVIRIFLMILAAIGGAFAAALDPTGELEKSAIRDLMQATPNIPQNQNLLARLSAMLQKKRVLRDPFTYTANIVALAAAANTSNQINIQADSDFLIQACVMFADLAAAAQTVSGQVIPLCTVLLTDSGSGRQFMDSDVPISSIFGLTGSEPFILPQPKLMAARSTLTVKTTNFSAATTYNIRLAFIGVKLFSLG